MKEIPAGNIHNGWIRIPSPAVPNGWHKVTRAAHAGGWSTFVCGRPFPYVTGSRVELYWSPTRPDGT